MHSRRALAALSRIAGGLLALLLMLELMSDSIGWMLSGALGQADDARGAILLIGPGCIAASLVLLWFFRTRASAWILGLATLSYPYWAPYAFGSASQANLWPFWSELGVVLLWPLWGLLGFQAAALAVRKLRANVA